MIDKKTAEALIIDRKCLQDKVTNLEQQLKDIKRVLTAQYHFIGSHCDHDITDVQEALAECEKALGIKAVRFE